MRKLTLAALTAIGTLAFGAEAWAGMEGLFGNTLVVTYPAGIVVKLHLKADGTYDSTTRAGVSSGTYAVNGDKICFTQVAPTPPAGMEAVKCGPSLDGRKPGDAWEIPLPDGGAVKLEVVAGS